MKIKVERKIHGLWKGIRDVEIKIGLRLHPSVGKFQYIYSSEKGTISLIKINNSLTWNKKRWKNSSWEICGGGITNSTRFPTKVQADKFIRRILS